PAGSSHIYTLSLHDALPIYQHMNDLVQFANRLEKRVHDLKLSRQITIQSAPQIRLIQNTNQALIEKIQSSVLTSIPLWKNQIARSEEHTFELQSRFDLVCRL